VQKIPFIKKYILKASPEWFVKGMLTSVLDSSKESDTPYVDVRSQVTGSYKYF